MSTCQCCGNVVELENDGRVKFHFSGLIIEGFTNVCLGVRQLPAEVSIGDIPNYITAATTRKDFIIADQERREAEESTELLEIDGYIAGRNSVMNNFV